MKYRMKDVFIIQGGGRVKYYIQYRFMYFFWKNYQSFPDRSSRYFYFKELIK